jgi:hypothetical protein
MSTDTTVLATAWIHQPALGQRPARTLLVGAARLSMFYSFGSLGFDLQAHSTTITDDPAETISWLADALHVLPKRLLLWRAEDIVVPSLVAAAETARDVMAGTRMLRELDLAFTGDVIDVAEAHGGAAATSFDAIAHRHGFPVVALSKAELAEAHRTGNHGSIRKHLAARAIATWRLWLASRDDAELLIEKTEAWLATPDAEVRL